MESIGFEALASDPDPFDDAVMASSDIDFFCSSSAWVVSAQLAFHPLDERLVLRSEAGWAAFARADHFGLGRCYAALEAMWGLACPIVGPDAKKIARHTADELVARRAGWDTLWLGGIVRGSPLFRELVARLSPRVGPSGLRLGPPAARWVASLDGGFDGWLGRRSAKFRANTRRAMAKAREAGLALDWITTASEVDAASLYDRILAIDDRSWKGREGVGLKSPEMRAFYAAMIPRLASRGRLRVLFGRIGEEDVAFVFGGVLGDTYRGLQMSFDDRFRALALGNVMQAHAIACLAADGVRRYDLGSDIDYKARWAERGLETVTLVAFAR